MRIKVLNTLQKVVLKEDFVLEKAVFFFKCMRVNLNSQSLETRFQTVCVFLSCQWGEPDRWLTTGPPVDVCKHMCVLKNHVAFSDVFFLIEKMWFW